MKILSKKKLIKKAGFMSKLYNYSWGLKSVLNAPNPAEFSALQYTLSNTRYSERLGPSLIQTE